MQSDSMTIVLAEDDDGHAALVECNLRRAGVDNAIVRVRDGQEALDYIRREGAFADRPAGGALLLLLDLNMPRVNGLEALRRLRADPHTVTLPVIVLTTTDDPREMEHCYALGCNVFLVKPVEYDAFVEAVQRLGLFLAVVRVPREKTEDGSP